MKLEVSYLGMLLSLVILVFLVVCFKALKNKSESEIALLIHENSVCRVCFTVPNTIGHMCTLDVVINEVWEPSSKSFAHRDFSNPSLAFGKFYRQTQYRFVDTVMRSDKQLRICSKIHRSPHEAEICGQMLIRDLQVGEYVNLLADANLNFVNEGQTPRGTIMNFSEDAWAHIVLMHNLNCFYCGSPGDCATFHKEHRIPLTRGGINHAKNMVPACQSCNLAKGTHTDDEFLELRLEKFRSMKSGNGFGSKSISLDPFDFSIMNWDGLPRNHYKVSDLNLQTVEFLIPMISNNSDWGELPITESFELDYPTSNLSSTSLIAVKVQDVNTPKSNGALFRLFLKLSHKRNRRKIQYQFLYSLLQSELVVIYESIANESSTFIYDSNGVETAYVHLGKTLYRPWFSQIL